MSPVELKLGPLEIADFEVRRSGIRWLREDGQICRAGEVIGFCNIQFVRLSGNKVDLLFADEVRDLQVAIIAPLGGRLRQHAGVARGGFLNYLTSTSWRPNTPIGWIDPLENAAECPTSVWVDLTMMAGRRVTDLAEQRSGLLTGWYDRSRAWRVNAPGRMGTLLSMGICELEGVIKGELNAFTELMEAARGSLHVVLVSDVPLVPCARVALEQMQRDDAAYNAITQDMARTLACGLTPPDHRDWMFAGALQRALKQSPLSERFTVIDGGDVRHTGPPDAVILSVSAEAPQIFRHRRLGYALHFHGYRLRDSGRAFFPWLRTNFEPVRRTIDDIRADYRALIGSVRAAAPETCFLICNMMSSSGQEDVQNYAVFDAPLGDAISSVRSKEMNLMLTDLARELDVSIVDIDAIAAELGAGKHISDGVHQDGTMQTEVRSEILHILRTRKFPGVASTPFI